MSRGGDGVWKSILDVLCGRRGGVDKPKGGSGECSRTGDSCGEDGEAAVTKLSGKPLELFCSGETAEGCKEARVPDSPGSADAGKSVGLASGVLVI